MSLSAEQVQQVAQLARLELQSGQLEAYAGQLSRIVDLFGELAKADTEGVGVMAHPLDMVQRLRADTVTEPNNREVFQAHAPSVQDGLYLVPKVIE